jgi:hypothetical protein
MKGRAIILAEGKEIIRTFNGYYRRQSMKILTIPANLQKDHMTEGTFLI